MSDRLARLEDLLKSFKSEGDWARIALDLKDARWLIAEVKRLRESRDSLPRAEVEAAIKGRGWLWRVDPMRALRQVKNLLQLGALNLGEGDD